MADGYLVIFAGQSLVCENPNIPAPPEATYSHVYMMAPGTRVFTPFSTVQDGGNISINAYKSATPATMGPVTKFAYEWEGRHNNGVELPELFILTVAQEAAGFTLNNTTADRSQWNLERKRNATDGGWDGTYYSIPTETSPDVWEEGTSMSCVSTLQQCIAAAIADIAGRGLTPKHLFTCWIHGQVDASYNASYATDEQALRELVDTALGIDDATWLSVLLSGQALSRTYGTAQNYTRSIYASNTPNTRPIKPVEFAEYDSEADDYGIHDSSGLHLNERGAWRIGGDECYTKSIDNGYTAMEIPV